MRESGGRRKVLVSGETRFSGASLGGKKKLVA